MTRLTLPVLSNTRITLREWCQNDLPAVEDASTDPYIVETTTVPSRYTKSEGVAWLNRLQSHLTEGRGYPFAISEELQSEALGMVAIIIGADGRWEASYWIRPAARGRGIASEALTLAAEWALQQDEAASLELWIEPWNTASIRVAEYAGFEFKSVCRDTKFRSGEREAYVYERRASSSDEVECEP